MIELVGIIILLIIELGMILHTLNSKVNWKSFLTYFVIVIGIFLCILNVKYSSFFVRLLFSTLIVFFATQILSNDYKNIARNFLTVIFIQFIFVISEIIFSLLVIIISEFDMKDFILNYFGSIQANVFISLIALYIFSTKRVQKLLNKYINLAQNITNKTIIVIVLFSLFLINLLLANIYYKVNLVSLIIINTTFIGFLIFVVYKLLDEKNNLIIQTNRTLQYKIENEALINNLHEYEKLADQHRVLNHENKNQLLAIKQMIQNKEDRVIPYIDNLLKTKIPDNQSLLSKTKRIPSGGLQGIIYQKLLLVKKKKIHYSLNISRELKNLDFNKLDIDTNVDLCKIVGVFLDNAIDEVKKLKEKSIGVELYVEDDSLCISVSNTYGKHTDFTKIGEEGYSTKGDGHGYGLTLVRELVENNDRFENTKSVIGKYFIQIIKVSNMNFDEK